MMRRICLTWVVMVSVLMGFVSFGSGGEEKPPADVAAVLKQALKERRVVMFSYHGHARTVEPHALGKGSEDKPVLLAWQTAGGSQTEPPPGWRVFLLAEIKELKPTEATFAKARPDFGNHKLGRGLKSVEEEVAVE